jgi:RNA polymerase sigma-70 factor, ECF subfamily
MELRQLEEEVEVHFWNMRGRSSRKCTLGPAGMRRVGSSRQLREPQLRNATAGSRSGRRWQGAPEHRRRREGNAPTLMGRLARLDLGKSVASLQSQNSRAVTKTAEIDMAKRLDPDHELLTSLREREPTAAEALITAYGDRAYRLAVRITGNEQDAEEAVQDGFWSVVRKIDTFRGDSAFGSWVYRIISNAAYEKIRRRPRAFVDISLDEVCPPFDQDGRHTGVIRDWSPSINDPVVQSELRAVLKSAISDLPVHYRTVIILRDVEGLSNAEIADALRITIPTAKTRAHRARLFLRKRLSIFMAGVGGSVGPFAQQDYVGRIREQNHAAAGTCRVGPAESP